MPNLLFSNRDFSTWPQQPAAAWTVDRLSWSAMGGPRQAWASCRRLSSSTVEPWVDLLRRPVEIAGEGGLLWWGYVASVELRSGAGSFCYTLDRFANTVRYAYIDPDGVTQVCATSDPDSIARYGVKEAFVNLELANSPRAGAVARAILQSRNTIHGPWSARSPGPDEQVLLGMRGWWDTLGWRYFVYSGQGNAQAPERWLQNASANIGSSATLVKGEQVLLDANLDYPCWNPVELEFMACLVGAPGDKLRLAVHAVDASNLPSGSPLDQVDVTVTGTAMAPYRVVLNQSAQVTPGLPFALVFSRSGSPNSSNYYKIGLYEPGSSPPVYPYKFWNGSTWAARSPASAALLRVYGAAETSGLVQFYAAKSEGGQFLEGVRVLDRSGISSSSYRNQVYTYRDEIEELLGAGSASGRRMLAEVTPGRLLCIRQAPDPGALDLLIDPTGRLLDRSGLPVSGPQAAGRWARFSAWPDLPPVWVGQLEWDGKTGRILPVKE